jgi:hypothetical protein
MRRREQLFLHFNFEISLASSNNHHHHGCSALDDDHYYLFISHDNVIIISRMLLKMRCAGKFKCAIENMKCIAGFLLMGACSAYSASLQYFTSLKRCRGDFTFMFYLKIGAGELFSFFIASTCSRDTNFFFWPDFRIFSVVFVVIPHSATSRAIGDDTSTTKVSNSGV